MQIVSYDKETQMAPTGSSKCSQCEQNLYEHFQMRGIVGLILNRPSLIIETPHFPHVFTISFKALKFTPIKAWLSFFLLNSLSTHRNSNIPTPLIGGDQVGCTNEFTWLTTYLTQHNM